MTRPADIERVLGRAGYRLTGPRRTLAVMIAGHGGPFTAADLVAQSHVRRLGIGRATVFRTIETLERLGAIERLDLPDGEHGYVVCEQAHHHHIVCSRCGRAVGIEDAGLRTVVAKVTRQTGFRIDEHRLELFGVCPACLAAQTGPSRATA